MASTDWGVVFKEALSAAQDVLAGKWPLVRQAATSQVAALIENAKELEAKKASLKPGEYDLVKRIQKRALAGVLSGFAAIGIVIAEQAAEAAWNIVAAALKASTGLMFIA